MKNEQIVKYSPQEEKFKSEGLLYMDLDSDVRAGLFDLFSGFSEYKKYRVLSKSGPILCLLFAVLVAIGFMVLFLSVGLVEASKANGGNTAVVGNANDVRKVANSTSQGNLTDTPNGTQNGTIASNSSNAQTSNSTNSSLSATNVTVGVPSDDNNIDEPTVGARLLQESQPKLAVVNTDNPNSPGFPHEMKASLSFVAIVLVGITILIIFLECRKRQLMIQLKNYEFNAINLFLSRFDKKVDIHTEHAKRKVLWVLGFFNVYDFQFLVRKLDGGEEKGLLNDRQSFDHRSNSFAALDNENSINDTLEAEGEKYQSAIINLNKKLDRMNIKGV